MASYNDLMVSSILFDPPFGSHFRSSTQMGMHEKIRPRTSYNPASVALAHIALVLIPKRAFSILIISVLPVDPSEDVMTLMKSPNISLWMYSNLGPHT